MLFNTLQFIIFFLGITIIYYIVPRSWCRYLLLIGSYIFYMGWNVTYSLLLFSSTLITFLCARGLSKHHDDPGRKKAYLVISLILNLGLLAFFKYTPMLADLLKMGLGAFGVGFDYTWNILLPVGISFYIFQALGYTIDVYREMIDAEDSFVDYALFVSFFPQLVAGPIERSGHLLPQIKQLGKNRSFDLTRIEKGVILMLWGFFIKMVIADRIADYCNQVFANYHLYGTIELAIGCIAFLIQIYCDFSGYSLIAIGAAKVLGIELMDNFNAPLFSQNLLEYWRRWHISLSTWLQDYLYYPLMRSKAMSDLADRYMKKGKKKVALQLPTSICLIITMAVSGLWHGAALKFVAWGLLHGCYEAIESITAKPVKKLYKKLSIDTSSFSHKLLMIIKTNIIVALTLIPFRANTMHDAVGYIKQMLTHYNPWSAFDYSITGTGTVYGIGGLTLTDWHILLIAILLLTLVDLLKYKKNISIDEWVMSQGLWLRWTIVIALFTAIWVWGSYGPYFSGSAFIYFQF